MKTAEPRVTKPASQSSDIELHRVSSPKVLPGHLEKLAIVYVRQSSPTQVLEHRESTARQYALADRAVAFGWARERILTIDGVRVEYKDGFGLARASNTTPVIVLRFEADTTGALERIKQSFRSALQPLKPNAPLPY